MSLVRIFTVLFAMCFFSMTLVAEDSSSSFKQQKKLLILSSTGGGGHAAAAATIRRVVGDEYAIHIIHPIDQLRIWSVPYAERIYNQMLQSGWTRSMNFIVRHIAPHLFNTREEKLEHIIGTAIEAFDPDLVVSLIPFVNYPATEAARVHNVPYLLITTDNNLRNWVHGLEKLKHPQFKVTIGNDLPTSRDLLLEKNIPEESILTIGLPLRPEFIEVKDNAKIKQELGIEPNKPVILLMMGGAGGNKAFEYAKKVGRMDFSAHLVVVAGRNQKLFDDLNRLKIHYNNTMSVFGYTDRVADLMAVADVIITKPGPGTINEALAMQLPMLIDNTERSLFWERVNVDVVLNYGVGERIRHPDQIRGLLSSYLEDVGVQKALKAAFTSVPPNRFNGTIKGIIDEMASPLSRYGFKSTTLDQSRVAEVLD